MEPKDIELLSNAAIPENIRLAIAQSFLNAKPDDNLELQKLNLERSKFIWNTPTVAALSGLITLCATFVFDRITKKDQVTNTITLEQVRLAITDSEARLKQQLEEKTKKTVAEIDALSKEREFQYKIVTDELADKTKTNVQRASVLLFLARAGVLTTLKADELQKMAEDQKANPNQDIIPQLKPVGSPPILALQAVAAITEAPWQVGLVPHGTRNLFCNGVLVDQNWVLTVAHCVDNSMTRKDPAKVDVIVGTHDYTSGGQQIEVEAIYSHPKWNRDNNDFNAALLKLKKSSSQLGKPIAMGESENQPRPGMVVRVTAWGVEREGGAHAAYYAVRGHPRGIECDMQSAREL